MTLETILRRGIAKSREYRGRHFNDDFLAFDLVSDVAHLLAEIDFLRQECEKLKAEMLLENNNDMQSKLAQAERLIKLGMSRMTCNMSDELKRAVEEWNANERD